MDLSIASNIPQNVKHGSGFFTSLLQWLIIFYEKLISKPVKDMAGLVSSFKSWCQHSSWVWFSHFNMAKENGKRAGARRKGHAFRNKRGETYETLTAAGSEGRSWPKPVSDSLAIWAIRLSKRSTLDNVSGELTIHFMQSKGIWTKLCHSVWTLSNMLTIII